MDQTFILTWTWNGSYNGPEIDINMYNCYQQEPEINLNTG